VLNIYLTKKSLVDIAQHIERVVCNFSGGYQDYYPAVYGGINSIEFKKNGNVKLEPIHLSTEQTKNLESSIILLYTNLNRDSSLIIDGISKNISRKKNYFDKIKNEAKMASQHLPLCEVFAN
jgi:D-glycero-alpha-D-manno-heptose-7-phosphate kinase